MKFLFTQIDIPVSTMRSRQNFEAGGGFQGSHSASPSSLLTEMRTGAGAGTGAVAGARTSAGEGSAKGSTKSSSAAAPASSPREGDDHTDARAPRVGPLPGKGGAALMVVAAVERARVAEEAAVVFERLLLAATLALP